MATINLLDTQTANLIAAGEVVERPANVIKELLENAIDAKADTIKSEIEGGGIDLIRVTDNGVGMEQDDLPLAIRRHATSKIKDQSDLDAIGTLGFRGEALAAISSASRMTILSKRKDDPVGHQITVEGERVTPPEECGAANGTSVIVRDLFFNQPARRKFLKRPQTESAAILQYLQRLAVSHPEISFSHRSDGALKLQSAGNGKLFDCIYAVYGSAFASALVELKKETDGAMRLHGFITRPESPRSNHADQSFYINSRYVKSRTMQFALEDAYKSFVKSEKFPGCVLFLEVDPSQVDVNVHPAKLEVRFSNERAVYQMIYNAVRKTLAALSNSLARTAYREAVEKSHGDPAAPLYTIHETTPPPAPSPFAVPPKGAGELPLFAPAPSLGRSSVFPKPAPAVPGDPFRQAKIEQVPSAFFDLPQKETASKPPLPEQAAPAEEQLILPGVTAQPHAHQAENNPLAGFGKLCGAAFDAFLFYETADRLFIIDKHAAHERILYESLKKSHGKADVQMLLEPLVITLLPAAAATLSEFLEEMNAAGFLLEEFGEGAFLLRGIPVRFCALGSEDLIDLLQKSADELSLGGKAGGAAEKRFDRTLYSMACKAAVKAGIPSTESDHRWIVEKLMEIDNITVCPHGRPVMVSYSKKEIESLFLRT